MTPPVTIGLVGIGFARQVLAPAFRADPRSQLVAVSARDLSRAQEAAVGASKPGQIAAEAEGAGRVLALPNES